jgi:ankyrin repeat protein
MTKIGMLFDAIEDKNVEAVQKMLADDPELIDSIGDFFGTPLINSVSCIDRRSLDVINVILMAGANVNFQTSEGYTALHCAVGITREDELDTVEVLGRLIASGANLELRQHYGWTPLLRAVVEGSALEVKTLLAAGANPNVSLPADTLPAFNAGRTALMAALTNPDAEEIVDALLIAGADPMKTAANGETFFDDLEALQVELKDSALATKAKRCLEIVRNKFKQS